MVQAVQSLSPRSKSGVYGLSPGTNLLTVYLSPSVLFCIPERAYAIHCPHRVFNSSKKEVTAEFTNKEMFSTCASSSTHAYFHACALEDIHTSPQHYVLALQCGDIIKGVGKMGSM